MSVAKPATVAMLGLLGACSASLDSAQAPEATTPKAAAFMGGGATAPVAVTETTKPTEKSATGAAAAIARAGKTEIPSALATPKVDVGSPSYKINALDVLEVVVFKVPDLNRTVTVAENGAVNLPLIGETNVAGMTAQEIERDLAKRLGAKYLQNPQVSISVKEFNSQRVTIEGAVKKQGVYPLRGKTTLLQIIATADGLSEVAESEVVVVREVKGKRTASTYNLDELRSGAIADPQLLTGDFVIVGTSAIKTALNNVLKALPLATLAKPF